MKAMDKNLSGEVVRWQEKLFKRSVRRQTRLRKIKQLLGVTSNQQCLEIGSGDGVISSQLRAEGGSWMTLVPTVEAEASMRYFVKGNVRVLQNETIDAPDQSFDAVVVVDTLERMRDDQAFIKECHRVLKTDGRLIISVARRGIFGFLKTGWKRKGLVRSGYSEHFHLLC